jgi:hypothetical protein
LKTTPIAKYLDQRARPEPVAWPPARRDVPPGKPKPLAVAPESTTAAAPLFRRATLFDAAESRNRDAADRRAAAPAEPEGRRRESIFSRNREPEPEPDPEAEMEARLAEAYHRGVQEGLDAANAEAATARALERAELQKRAVVERLDFQMNEYAKMAEAISGGLVEVEKRIADVVARILQPLVSDAVAHEIVEELVANIARVRGAGRPALMTIRGPERLLRLLKPRIAQVAIDVEFVDEGGVDVTVESQHTTIQTELAPWADLIASFSEGD